jgi:hypothetical protein
LAPSRAGLNDCDPHGSRRERVQGCDPHGNRRERVQRCDPHGNRRESVARRCPASTARGCSASAAPVAQAQRGAAPERGPTMRWRVCWRAAVPSSLQPNIGAAPARGIPCCNLAGVNCLTGAPKALDASRYPAFHATPWAATPWAATPWAATPWAGVNCWRRAPGPLGLTLPRGTALPATAWKGQSCVLRRCLLKDEAPSTPKLSAQEPSPEPGPYPGAGWPRRLG